jgi:hypothetical protein
MRYEIPYDADLRKDMNCNHERCQPGPCKALRPEDIPPFEEDFAVARELIAQGFRSTSNKYRHVRRLKRRVASFHEVVRPEFHDHPVMGYIADRWGMWESQVLRCGSLDDVEEKTLTVRQYRAFKLLGGYTA